jgi:hypothetical protein
MHVDNTILSNSITIFRSFVLCFKCKFQIWNANSGSSDHIFKHGQGKLWGWAGTCITVVMIRTYTFRKRNLVKNTCTLNTAGTGICGYIGFGCVTLTGTAFQTTYGYAPQLPYVWCTAGIHVLPRYMCVPVK